MITQAQVQHLFDYKDGELFWKNPTHPTMKQGDEAGSLNSKGYKKVNIEGKSYLTHRVIFLFHNGYLPEIVDHVDGDPLNNDIENLRGATKSQNQFNSKMRKNNTSGHKGVKWHKATQKWYGTVRKNGKNYNTTVTEDIQEAIMAVEKLREQLHGAFARHA